MNSNPQKTCLIADDARSMRVLINNWMTRAGFLCCVTENGDAAKAVIEKSCPDILITDIEMPFLNGLELVCWSRQSRIARISTLPIIVITSLDDPELERIVGGIGTRFVLRKPLSEHIFLETVQEAMSTIKTPSCCHSIGEPMPETQNGDSLLRRMAQNAMRHNFTNDAL